MEADALHDFVASAEDELSFSKGAMLKVLNVEEDPNWYQAELDGRTGLVPCNYITLRPHPWFVSNCSRAEAELKLLEMDAAGRYVQPDGAFILRQSEAGGMGFSLSVKNGESVLHFKVLQDQQGKYFLWVYKFDSINLLIDHHRRASISRSHELCLVDCIPSNAGAVVVRNDPRQQRVIARFDFEGKDSEELTFRRGEVIVVIGREDENWWRGRMSDGREGLFPANYVDKLPDAV